MPKKRFSSEQIIAKLRQIEVQLAHGKSIALACKEAGISKQSYYRWRKEYGGLQIEQARRLKIWSARTPVCAASWRTSPWRSRSSGTLPRETYKPRAAPAGGEPHPGEV
jgi:putative transposase